MQPLAPLRRLVDGCELPPAESVTNALAAPRPVSDIGGISFDETFLFPRHAGIAIERARYECRSGFDLKNVKTWCNIPKERKEEKLGEEAQDDGLAAADALGEDEAPEKLNLTIDVQKPSACERHITVTVPREDIDRYLRQGVQRVDADGPRARLSARARAAEAGRASLPQGRGRAGQGLAVDGQPGPDSRRARRFRRSASRTSTWTAVEVPDEGPMTFEFDLEVRPEFDLPQVEGAEDREAGARVHRRRRRRAA